MSHEFIAGVVVAVLAMLMSAAFFRGLVTGVSLVALVRRLST